MKWPCFYGIDFATRAELIANGLNNDEICRSIGADSLGYVSLDGLVAATRLATTLCRACFDGVYPIELPLSERLGKSILEDPADLEPVVAGVVPPMPSLARSPPVRTSTKFGAQILTSR